MTDYTPEALEALSKKAQEPGALIADKGAFLIALETAYRTGQLILAQPSGFASHRMTGTQLTTMP